MKCKRLLAGLVVCTGLGLLPQVGFAEEVVSEQEEATVEAITEESAEAVETAELPEELPASESIENEGTDLTHTHQASVEEFVGPQVESRSSYQQNFINQVAPSASSLANANNMYASVMIAQAIVESGWGKSGLSAAPNYNLFGIKGSYNGQSVYFPTQEYVNGKWITINAAFRKYPSYAQSLQDNVNIIKNTSFYPGNYYYSGAWKSNTKSYKDATAYLTGRYATAPNYNTALNNMIESYNLTRYDNGGGSGGSSSSTNAMHRLYNKNSGEHFYTASVGEKDNLVRLGWQYEGIGWYAPKSGDRVYRLYNKNSGGHHYTTKSSERDNLTRNGWKYEGIGWYSSGNINVYRLYNPNARNAGTHHFTTKSSERNMLMNAGWRFEGNGWKAAK